MTPSCRWKVRSRGRRELQNVLDHPREGQGRLWTGRALPVDLQAAEIQILDANWPQRVREKHAR